MTETEPDYVGRPFGGVAIICNRNKIVTYRELPIATDKAVAVCVSDTAGVPSQIVLNVYMPFFSNTLSQSQQYTETVDILQSFYDQFAAMALIKFVGDFNVQLPLGDHLRKKWYARPGFNRHSAIMYDFLSGNDLILSDFQFQQSVKYTHFCDKTDINTWIDHVASAKFDSDNVILCEIVPHAADNVNDHLPMVCHVKVASSNRSQNVMHARNLLFTAPAHLNWNRPCTIDKYIQPLESILITLPAYANSGNIDHHIRLINDAMHDAAHMAGCLSIKVYKPKAYWYPELSQLRDRKRFWWTIWVANGRPRVKKLFRKTSRKKNSECH